ncbi:MAG: hypothetical protein IT177_01635 [Acidobacteria bacterium]|nr:hypothetical protein [Acidobacteriota bacterium]
MGDALTFSSTVTAQPVPTASLLTAFLRLQHASPRQVLRFAQRWGDLHLCRHGAPLDVCGESRCLHEPVPTADGHTERVSDWQLWAGRFAAILHLCRTLDDAATEWDRGVVRRALEWWSPGRADVMWRPPARHAQRVRRAYLVLLLNHLLTRARVRREVVTSRQRMVVVEGSRWLFGALVTQLVQACVGVRSLAVCAECGAGFTADRRTAKYCPRCRARGVRQKRAMQARRDRLRALGQTSRGSRLARRRAVPTLSLSPEESS